ncbi:hypothetical protein AX17_004169 [Amanita inopinata Kibby_2008]|nr:hypothetical protein AX17_004169 [Amanita inopinata Kibby_2008]
MPSLCQRYNMALDPSPDDSWLQDHVISPPHSLVPHLLGTNTHLCGSLASQVKDTFSPVQQDITLLDARIARLSAALNKLKEKRGKLQNYLDQHQALLSPARRVPPEIWGEIFQYCLSPNHFVRELKCDRPSTEEEEGEDMFSSCISEDGMTDEDCRAPWVFTRISRDLRVAAMSCPRLWTRVSVCVDDHAVLDRRKLWPLAHFLRLSGDLPLSVTLFGRSYDMSAFEMWTKSPAAQVLAATCQRWERLHLSHVPCPTRNGFYTALRNRLHALKVLEMHLTPELPRMKPLACDVFVNVPKLHTLRVAGAFPYDALQLPMQQIATCYMHSDLHFPRLIQSCSGLAELTLTVPPFGIRTEPFSSLKSDYLRTLRLDLYTSDHILIDQIMRSLDLPSLSTLHLECQQLPDAATTHFFKKNSSITHLTFRVQEWAENSFLHSLRSLTSLEQLCIYTWPGSFKNMESILNNLARRRRTPEHFSPLLPNLQTIELVSHVADFPVDPFVRLIRSRWALGRRGGEVDDWVVSQLRSAILYLHGGVDPADHLAATLSKLSDVKDGGLDVRAYLKGLLTPGFGRRIF